MILQELLNNDTLVKHYSDQGFKLRQVETGFVYDEPIDINPCPYTYEETNEKINASETEEYIKTLEDKVDTLNTELLDTQMALCDIYELLEG